MVRVYSRPVPVAARSDLSFTARFPVICQSGEVSPSPRPLIGSLLLTAAILQTGAASQLSDTGATMVTGTILWFGGQRTLGRAVTVPIVGGVVSCTVALNEQLLLAPLALQVTVVVPLGKAEPDGGVQLALTPGAVATE